MHLNVTPAEKAQKPNWLDYAELTRTLLPDALVALAPLPELKRRIEEINIMYPRFREETPLVLAYEVKRRTMVSRWMHQPVTSNVQVA
jgi:hypothetical protein